MGFVNNGFIALTNWLSGLLILNIFLHLLGPQNNVMFMPFSSEWEINFVNTKIRAFI